MKSILWVALGLLLTVTACKKDENTTTDCMKLEGKWSATSWKEDGEQFFGDSIFIISSEIEFKKLVDTLGDVDWMINYTLGGLQDLFGSYVVNASCDSLTITPKSGSPTHFAFTITGDQLTLDSHDNNIHVVQEYTRQ
jgi:hypothetical protein